MDRWSSQMAYGVISTGSPTNSFLTTASACAAVSTNRVREMRRRHPSRDPSFVA